MGKYLSLSEAITLRQELQAAGKTLVFTNGHFDLLHVGHLDYIEKARELGDALIVGLNGDASTTRLKGAGRPITPALERARLMAALVPVTATIIFEEDTANGVISALKPEIYVKGGDYGSKPLPERPIVEAYGGQVILIDLVPERSTTALIQRIRKLSDV